MVRHDLVVLWNNVLTWYYRGVECTEPIRKAYYFELYVSYINKLNSELDLLSPEEKKTTIERLDQIK